MDYYYALLDSYKLLKKRKLQLTINEEMDDAGVLKYLTTQAAGGTADQPNVVLGNIRLFTPKDDPQSVTGGLGQAAARLVEGGQLAPYDSLNDTGKKIIDRIKSGEEEGGDNTPTEDPVVRKELDKAAAAWNKFVNDEGGYREAMFPGLKSTRGRIAKSVVNILSKGSTILGFGGDKPDDVVQQMLNTPCTGSEEELQMCNANKLEAARALTELGTIFKQFKDDGELTQDGANKLRSLNPKLTITKSGIKFGEVFIFHKTNSSSETDVLRNAVDQLSEAAEKYNEDWDGDSEGKIPLVGRVASGGGGINRALRGTAAEAIVGLSVTMMNLRRSLANTEGDRGGRKKAIANAKKEVSRILAAARKKKDGASTLEDLRDMFKLGSDVDLGRVLAMGDDQSADVDYFNEIGQFYLDKGMDENDLRDLLERGGDEVGTALVLLAYANRDFDYQLFGDDIIPESVQQEGQTGSNDLGSKTDVGVNYDAKDCTAVQKHYGSLLSDDQKKHYSLGCGEGSDGVGLDNLTQSKDKDPNNPGEGKKCYVGVEIKTLDNLRSNKGYGQSSNSRAGDLFSREGGECSDTLDTSNENKASKEFVAAHEQRMENCGVSSKAACSFAQSVEKDIADIRAGLDVNQTTWPNGKNITLTQRVSLLQKWASNKGGYAKLTDADKMRYDGALRQFNGEPQAADMTLRGGDAGQAAPIADQLWQHHLTTVIGANEEPITGDAQDYLLSRLHLGAGSLTEVGKVGRRLEEGTQSFGLNNAEIMGCIGGVKKGDYTLVRSGNTYKIVDKEGNLRMQMSAERGNFDIAGSKATGNDIQDLKESLSINSNDILLEFLKGQQVLLNQLMQP